MPVHPHAPAAPQDRRVFPRWSTAGLESALGRVTDLSLSGMRIRKTGNPGLREGARFRLEVRHDDAVFLLPAQLSSTRPHAAGGAGGMVDLGIHFPDLTKAQKKAVKSMLVAAGWPDGGGEIVFKALPEADAPAPARPESDAPATASTPTLAPAEAAEAAAAPVAPAAERSPLTTPLPIAAEPPAPEPASEVPAAPAAPAALPAEPLRSWSQLTEAADAASPVSAPAAPAPAAASHRADAGGLTAEDAADLAAVEGVARQAAELADRAASAAEPAAPAPPPTPAATPARSGEAASPAAREGEPRLEDPQGGGNKRKNGRLAAQDAHTALGEVLDISASGMRIRRRGVRAVELGSVFLLDLYVCGRAVRLPVEVMRIQKSGWRSHDYGLRFGDLPPEMKREFGQLARMAAKHVSIA